VEDQGWVAWFTIAAVLDRPVTIYGDGRQVRDVLFVDDLVDCYLAAVERIDEARGQAYNVGGGPDNTLSLLECLARLEDLLGKKTLRVFEAWRPGDQRVFVSGLEKARKQLGWSPRTTPDEGLSRLVSWVVDHRTLLGERTR
jgi:CDP-paratose 2-epimerase